MNPEQAERIRTGQGFIAALDQSGGSTPKALALYGVSEDKYSSEEQMFDLVHEMRTRIIKSPAFNSNRILAAILFEQTMDRQVDGQATSEYLWARKGIVPFLKVDQGLAPSQRGVQLMKPIEGLDALLLRAAKAGVFGTKMRSVIHEANPVAIAEVVDQQFAYANQIRESSLIPIIEPEVDISSPDKTKSETILREQLLASLGAYSDGLPFMLKLSIPTVPDFYRDLIEHPRVLRVVALSGGYSRDTANALLAKNHGLTASFSRALTEGLAIDQTEAEFDEKLDASIQSIFEASTT